MMITVLVGTIESINQRNQDFTKEVEFEGKELGSFCWLHGSDTRGTDQTLYETSDGRLLVHEERWSRWQGEPTNYDLKVIEKADLEVNGAYEMLGRECGFGRPLTVDEYLEINNVH